MPLLQLWSRKKTGDSTLAAQESPLFHATHAIMSRTGSFPLDVATTLLQTSDPKAQVIFDPFCGKGTTLLAARLLGKEAYGSDVAPEAIACTQGKMADVHLAEVIAYIDQLPEPFGRTPQVPPEVATFFSRVTIRQLLAIRASLLGDVMSRSPRKQAAARFTLATLLGILHGHSAHSLSISSSHAFSMAPGYVERLAQVHGLTAPDRNVKACLTSKASRLLSHPLPPSVPSIVKNSDARSCIKSFPMIAGKVDVLLTSPPYLHAQTYAKDNWLRLWFLGYNYRELHGSYIHTGSVARYTEMMASTLKQFHAMLGPKGVFICIAGDVRLDANTRKERIFNTAGCLADLASKQGFMICEHQQHEVRSQRRYFHALSSSTGHSKQNVLERIFIARKVTC